MTTQIFADGIGTITVTGPLVRIDLVTVVPNQKDANGRMATEVKGQLILPLEAFVRATVGMQQGVQQLVKAGVLKITPTEPAGTATAA